MERKKIIEIIVIVIAFAGSGFVLYNGFAENKSKPALQSALTTNPAVSSGSDKVVHQDQKEILPNGAALNFDTIDKKRFQFDVITYPKLDPNQEVGKPENELITSQLGKK